MMFWVVGNRLFLNNGNNKQKKKNEKANFAYFLQYFGSNLVNVFADFMSIIFLPISCV